MPHRFLLFVSTLVLLAATPLPAVSQLSEPLVEGRKAVFKDSSKVGKDQAKVTFVRDPGLVTLDDPTCDAVPSTGARVRFSSSLQTNPELHLPCENWRSSGTGFSYKDKTGAAGGIQKVSYKFGKLQVKAKGGNYAPAIGGPVDFLEVRFSAGEQSYCGRFSTFRRNEADRIIASGPTTACPLVCGDQIVEGGEECDDGNAVDGDGCENDCTITQVCGDGFLDEIEECDDGGTEDGDCCSATCTYEVGPCSDRDNCTQGDVCVAGECVGGFIEPWINEIDYDNDSGGIVDREEFVEIAGPAGMDLGGYTLYGVEGATGACQTPGDGLLSGPVLPGYVHWSVAIPPGTILNDDTGTGIGFYVICNSPSSQIVINAGNCDLTFPGIASDTNFKNGQLVNEPWICPDGMLLRDPQGGYTDAVSYEGIVPNAGPLGAFFHIDLPYNAGADEGWKPQTSLEKRTSSLGRASSASEWRDSGGCSDQCVFGGLNFGCDWFTGLDPCVGFGATPGAPNEGQQYFCPQLDCGDGVVTDEEECDLGEANSDDPDAACRTDCTLRRCGDGIIDPSAAPEFAEECEQDSDCGAGETCEACLCETGVALGDLAFTAIPGSAALTPVDDGESTWFRINQPLPDLFLVTSGSNGAWTPGPLNFTAGVRGVDDRARFYLTEPTMLTSPLPALAGGGAVCVKLRPDYDRAGFVDCDGGSNADVVLSVDSNFGAAQDPHTLTVASNPGDSGAGAAVAYVILESGQTVDDITPCEDAIYTPPIAMAITTGSSTTHIIEGAVVGNVTVTLTGQPFDCSNWTVDSGASIGWPNYSLDVTIPFLGVQDVAQVLRLNDD